MGITDNVVDLMVRQIKKLSEDTAHALSIGSIMGNQFDLKLLARIQNISVARVAETVWPSVKEGLLLPLNPNFNWVEHNWESDATVMFRFLHDRVQQAAESLLRQEEKVRLNLEIGRILRQLFGQDELFEHIFSIVDHLNKGRSLIDDKMELRQLCEYNLMAAKKARLSSAYEPALNYATTGNELLPENCWDENYALTLACFVEKGEILYLNSKWDEAIKTFDSALEHASSLLDRCKIIRYKANLYRMKNDLKAALDTGLKGLAELDICLQPFPNPENVKEELDRVQALFDAISIENLYDLPELDDPLKMMALELLTSCFGPAYFLGSRLISIIGARMSEITIKHGNSPLAEVGYIFYSAISLAVDLKDFDNAYKLGSLALRLNDQKYHEKANEALLLDMLGTFVCHHKEPIDNAKKHLMRGYFSGVENGSYQWAGYCAMINLFMSFWGCDSLQEVAEKIDKILPGLEKIDPNMAQYYYAVKAAVHNLREPVKDTTSLSPSIWPKMDEVLKLSKEQNDCMTLLVDTTCRLALANWYGQSEVATILAETGDAYVAGVPGVFINPVFCFHQALAFAGNYNEADSTKKAKYLAQIKATLGKFEHYASHCPENYLHQALLLKAELARISNNPLEAMDLYDQAIDSAQGNGFTQNQAFANELAGGFYLSLKKEKIAQLYLKEALYAYKMWGADALEAHLEKSYAHLNLAAYNIKTPSSESDSISQAPLDLNTIMQASQAISREIKLDKLLARIMEIILQSAGAQRGCLILKEKDRLMVSAKALMGTGIVHIPQSQPLEECEDISSTIVNYVVRTRENVILDNAFQDGMFTSDPYIANNKIKSILCMPIQYKGVDSGVLYLENRMTKSVFTKERVEILDIHLSQTAISLENARLYSQTTALNRDLQDEVRYRQQAQEETHLILQNAMEGIITIDEQGLILTFNPAAENMFSVNAEQAIGKNINQFMPEPYKSEHDENIRKYLLSGRSIILGMRRELEGLHNDGRVFPMEISISEMHHGDKRRFIGIVRDITERKRVDKELKSSLFTKELLLKEVYHRTKNNMQIISSLLRLQSKHILDKKYADIFLDSFNRINAMSLIHEKVYKTESLSHIDAGEYIDSLTEAILKTYGNGFDKIAIKTNIEGVFINLDVGIPMGLILNELISNAMKHAFPDNRAGTVEISLRYTAPKFMELIVRDDGVGFPDGVEFRRSKSLGLKLVALQAEGQLDGKITFDGTRGACYKIEFKEK